MLNLKGALSRAPQRDAFVAPGAKARVSSAHRRRISSLIMGRFADVNLPGFTDAELDQYEHLLDAIETDLLAWVTGVVEVPPDHDTAMFCRGSDPSGYWRPDPEPKADLDPDCIRILEETRARFLAANRAKDGGGETERAKNDTVVKAGTYRDCDWDVVDRLRKML